MEVYEFASESQYIFRVETDGIGRLVVFGEPYGNSASVFQTKDSKVAAAIRRTSMFRRGVIVETSHSCDESSSSCTTKESPKGSVTPSVSMEEKVFSNITQAKEWVSKEYKIPKSSLRKPESVAAAAKKHHVRLIIKAIES